MSDTEGHTHQRALLKTPNGGTTGVNIAADREKEDGSHEFMLVDGESITVSENTEWIVGPPELIEKVER